MTTRTIVAIALAGLCAIGPGVARAQDAAESAMIMSGSSQTGKAQRSLGNAISNSINRASNTIGATNAQRGASVQRRANGSVHVGPSLPAGVDPLEGTDTTTYRLGTGSSIRTTGRINTAPGSRCVSQCEKVGQKAAQ